MPDHRPCIFVYGTLMPGEERWPALEPYAASSSAATAAGYLWDTGRGYPAIRFDDRGDAVPGFLVTLSADRSAECLARLDQIEGEGVLFRRVAVTTSLGPATSYEWIGATDGFLRLPDGWARRSVRRSRSPRRSWS